MRHYLPVCEHKQKQKGRNKQNDVLDSHVICSTTHHPVYARIISYKLLFNLQWFAQYPALETYIFYIHGFTYRGM